MTSIARIDRSGEHDIESLRARALELDRLVAERAGEVARAQTDLAAFRIRYRQEVGTLHDELEELEHAIAEAELGEISRLLDGNERDARDIRSARAGSSPEAAPRLTSDAVRRLFRDVAKTIHPDLARDEQTRDRRHALMVEAPQLWKTETCRWTKFCLQDDAESPL